MSLKSVKIELRTNAFSAGNLGIGQENVQKEMEWVWEVDDVLNAGKGVILQENVDLDKIIEEKIIGIIIIANEVDQEVDQDIINTEGDVDITEIGNSIFFYKFV